MQHAACTEPGACSMSRYRFALADRDDDARLRERMNADVLEGAVAVTFRREPSYFDGASVQGDVAEVIKCEDKVDGRLVGLGARTRLQAYVNGRETTIGYLGDLRGAPDVRAGTLLARGFRELAALHRRTPAALYYTMILSDNRAALDALTGARASLPRYRPMGRFFTPTIFLDRLRRRRPTPSSVRIVRGSALPLERLIGFVNAQNARFQFSAVYRSDHVGSARLRGLALDDVFVAIAGQEILGCTACWDQSSFKQIHVERYNGALKWSRPFLNAVARVVPLRPLPAAGMALPCFHLAMIAVRDDDPAIFRALLEAIYSARRAGCWHFFVAGLHERHPLAGELARFRHVPRYGNLYGVHWDDGRAAFDALDGRVPHIETATL